MPNSFDVPTDLHVNDDAGIDPIKFGERALGQKDLGCTCDRWARRALGAATNRVGKLRKRIAKLQTELDEHLAASSGELSRLREHNEFLQETLEKLMVAYEARQQELSLLTQDTETSDSSESSAITDDNQRIDPNGNAHNPRGSSREVTGSEVNPNEPS